MYQTKAWISNNQMKMMRIWNIKWIKIVKKNKRLFILECLSNPILLIFEHRWKYENHEMIRKLIDQIYENLNLKIENEDIKLVVRMVKSQYCDDDVDTFLRYQLEIINKVEGDSNSSSSIDSDK